MMDRSSTSRSMPLLENVLNAFCGVLTMGSPFRLKDVFKITGTPVSWPNFSMSRYMCRRQKTPKAWIFQEAG